MGKKYIVVGASSGIGKAIAEQLLREGNQVALLARRDKILKQFADEFNTDSKNRNAITIKYDSNQFDKSGTIFNKIVKELGGDLDGIIYASGVMPAVGVDEYNTEKDLQMLNTNLLGAIAILNPAAEYFGKKGSGFIAGISSIAGDRGRRGNPVYNTSKAGLNTYLEALRNRLAVKGVQIVTIKPGFVSTDMLAGVKVPDKGFLKPITAEEAAATIIRRINSGSENFYVPAKWALVGLIIKNIPSFIFRKLNI
ncbi:SDR family NAD(P)-dependent oxidoreductase [Leptospira sp. GIMC2001]|uniref:SDR family NAD(P)-dependent oxidoreductase n=1 Tax=Leptospira sp. GIMC2001 TaxID=1513297 RepID=UPI00234B3191|nr:SDR family NAD(P)-dependent oxidoreductase [Leptospira sp. GIMC2001]WCL49086.1 SDR family NAD(P)-dependent oxidoreductase [Leptospira sp. GIMC2001]